MDINLLIWSYLIVFMLHNFEEILMIERWYKKTYPRIEGMLPSFVKNELERNKSMTAAQFCFIVFLLFIPVSALIIITVLTEQYFLFLSLHFIFALNIFTHPIQSLLLRCYVPGLWSTLLVIIPYNILVFIQFHQHGLFDLTTILKTLYVIIPFIPVFILSHFVAEKWARA